MKKILVICSCVLLVLVGCGKSATSVKQLEDLGNTPYQEDTIMFTYANNPRRALALLDSAVVLGNINDFQAKILRATIYARSLEEQQQDSARLLCEALLEHDSVLNNTDNYEMVLDLLISNSRARADDDDYLQWSTLKAELCREQGAEVELLRTEAEIGLVMTHLGQVTEGLAKLDNCIRQLDKPGSIDRMDAFIIAVKRKISVLNEQGRSVEVVSMAQRVLDRLDHYEQHAKEYVEDSYRLSSSGDPIERKRYIDFSRAQAQAYLAIAYASLSEHEGVNGDKKKAAQLAREHMALFDESDYGHTFSGRRMIVPAQMSLGMYDEALKTSNLQAEYMGADTMNVVYASILRYRSIVEKARGHDDKAFELMERYAVLSKEVAENLLESKAHDYAARYRAQEQELEIQQRRAKTRLANIVIFTLGVGLLFALVFVYYIVKKNKTISMKNHGLVKLIDEGLKYKERNDELQRLMHVQSNNEKETTPAINLKTLSNEDLFQHLCDEIRANHLYLDPLFDRQAICDRFRLTPAQVGSAFAQGSEYDSVSDFIRDCRLEYACTLLKTTDMKITDVASAAGFSRSTTFNHAFKARYNLSPTEYRQQ
ncbi:MAG: helix-turn-helix transcriptional regulator [Bacteroidaceae bacterium]|nr:helix-turn-helix transcriptional regulator [Bacteroidaceae bacterium]